MNSKLIPICLCVSFVIWSYLIIVVDTNKKNTTVKSSQQSVIVIDSINGDSVSVTQLGSDSSVIEINGKKWVNGHPVK